MFSLRKYFEKHLLISVLIVFSLAVFAACSSSETENDNEEHTEETEHEEAEHEESESEHEHESENEGRIPNDGAEIRIMSPGDGALFSEGDEISVEVHVSGFTLGDDGNHWHVYVDGTSWGMVMGGRSTEVLRGLEAGERTIEVYLNNGDHVELEDGDSVTILVE